MTDVKWSRELDLGLELGTTPKITARLDVENYLRYLYGTYMRGNLVVRGIFTALVERPLQP